VYTLYTDGHFKKALDDGDIPPEIYQKFIRDTVTCMYALSSQQPFNRWPAGKELEEMAKSICLEYPQLKNQQVILLTFYACYTAYLSTCINN